jgi:hypothetical protein
MRTRARILSCRCVLCVRARGDLVLEAVQQGATDQGMHQILVLAVMEELLRL